MRSLSPSSLLFLIGLILSALSVSAAPNPTEGDADSSAPASTESSGQKDATIDLDAASFSSQVTNGQGIWWVKHFSPYCQHCKAIAPVWSRLSNDLASEAEAAGFHFANIDCITNGDLCDAHDVAGYPTFILYQDGKMVERYSSTAARNYDGLKDYALKHMKKEAVSDTKSTTESVVAETGMKTENVEDAETGMKTENVEDVETGMKTENVEDAESARTVAGDESVAPKENANAEKFEATTSTTPNPNGVSVPLTFLSFTKLVTSTRDGYFIKFYVPWCSHCQALAPAWLELAGQMQGRLNIAEVNCDEETRLCKDARLRGYPSLMYFLGTERVEYDGLRGVGDLVAFANKALSARVRSVDATEFEEIERKEEVIFLYFYDENTAKEDFDALDRVALPLIGHAPLFTTTSAILASRFRVTTFPRLVAISDGRPSYYTALSPKDMRDHLKVLAWMKTVWLPILPELSAANSHEIMQGRTVVLGILDKSKEEEFELSKKELKAAALEWMDRRVGEEKAERQNQRELKEMKIEEANDKGDEKALKEAQNMHIVLSPRKEVGFAWVDGLFWERWLQKTYGIDVRETGQRVIINDEDNNAYWDQTAEGPPIVPTSRQAVLDTLRTVVDNRNKIKPKSTTSKFVNLVNTIKQIGAGYPFALVSFGIGISLVIAWYWKGKIRRFSRSVSGSGHHSIIPSSVGGGKFD
ncbi:thioredoxin-like protein [Lipomyces orientalis]|uniref:Thioredoxin-like protein n=1 Tax=Lipomyces orientalis TaxID=1233043 RepID=A0ACC3TPU2_9ASCO